MNLKNRSHAEMVNAGSITVKFDQPTLVKLDSILEEEGKKSKALLPNTNNPDIVSKVLEAHLYHTAMKHSSTKNALIKDNADGTFDWIQGAEFTISSDKDWNYSIKLDTAKEDTSISKEEYDKLPAAAQKAYKEENGRYVEA